MRSRRIRGVSLVELLLCFALLAVLIIQSIPGLNALTQRFAVETAINDIHHAISLARTWSITTGKMVTLCRSSDKQHCGGQWRDGLIVFTDQNGDRIVNDADEIVHVTPAFRARGSLRFRSFGNRQYLQLTPLGFTHYQNGNFTYCPENNDARLARQLVVSRTGRTRFAQDNDGDGIREDSSGEPLTCP